MAEKPWKPTPAQIAAARGKTVPDILGPGLNVLFCGINPSLYSAAVGHHFARPGNRFWPVLAAGGFTRRRLSPFEGGELLPLGIGITNVVARATAAAAELSTEEFIEGGRVLARKVERNRPRVVAFLGITAYRSAFGRPRAVVGPQEERLGGCRIWVLPNPSGLNAHYRLADLASIFAELREAAGS
ncbi:MAG TPA: G/U mismatch-specific DNA glycosylase [Isosphaeraceae bacterium]